MTKNQTLGGAHNAPLNAAENLRPGDDATVAAIDAADAEAVAASAPAEEPDVTAPDDFGQRIRRVITTRDFLPGGDIEWPRRNVAPAERGTRFILGTLRGSVISTERKRTMYQRGTEAAKELESVWLNGDFEAVLRGTGEVISAPTAILPKAFGYIIESALAGLDPADKAELKIDCDIGLESTARTIPYEWVVIYYREGKAQKAMREIRARSDARLARQTGPLRLAKPTPDKS